MASRRLVVTSSILVVGALVILQRTAFTQPQETREQRAARFRQRSVDAERTGLAHAFVGITTNGTVERDLFGVRSTGVSTELVRKAADAFLNGLTAEQRARTTFEVNDDEWRKWMNQDYYVRQGVSFLEMTQAQREGAFNLLRQALSAKGLKQTHDIMRLNHTLGELNDNDFDRYGEWRYHLTVMGTPSATEPWGWQFDGHHAIINYFVLGDQVVMTPFFAGSEPVIADSGIYKGTAVLQHEQERGLAMINGLPQALRQKAILHTSKIDNNNLTEAWKDNVVLDYAGVSAGQMDQERRDQLLRLIGIYVANLKDDHARVRMTEVAQHLDRTWFAWIGGTEPDSVFYYRIHSPVILIEFDHQEPANLSRFSRDPEAPSRQHIHVVVRTPNGNDYGKDLLRQHYERHPHL